jgi:uncharacterized protein (TIGR02268 family)
VSQADWSGQGFAWDGFSKKGLGTLVLLTLSLLTTTADAQQASGERQVESDHLLPSCEGCAKQLREAQEETRRCEASLLAQSAASDGANLLTGLLVSGKMDAQGILVRVVNLPAQAPVPVRVLRATSLRSVNSVAVRLEVQLPEGAPWTLEGAVLRTVDGGELPLKVWPSTPLLPGTSTLVFEREAGRDEMKRTYELQVREAGGSRTIVITGIQFP